MMLTVLYLRSRQAPMAVLAVALVTVCSYVFLRWYDDEAEALHVALILGPLAAACVVGAGVHSPFGEVERATSFPLARLRSAHLGGLLVGGAVALAIVVARWQEQDAPLAMARNVAGLGGLALLAASIVGARLSWVAPMVLGMATLFAPVAATPWWAWPAMSGGRDAAWVVAIVLLLVGLSLAASTRTRGAVGDPSA